MTVLVIAKKSSYRYDKVAGAPLQPGQLILFDGEMARLPACGPAETDCEGFVLRAWTIRSELGFFFVLSEFFQLPKEGACSNP